MQKLIFSFLVTDNWPIQIQFYRQSNLYSPLGKLCHYNTFSGSLDLEGVRVCPCFYVLWLLIENSTLKERK